MAGVKGRSGRKSMKDWEKINRIIAKAWDLAEKYLSDDTMPIEKRIEIAAKILVKDMPDKLTDGDGEALQAPVINIYGNRNKAEEQCVRSLEGDRSLGEYNERNSCYTSVRTTC